MTPNESKSLEELNEFIETFQLRDDNGNIIFPATIHFQLPSRSTTLKTDIYITLNSYHYTGTIFISLDDDTPGIDAKDYPIMFHANHQDYLFLPGQGLSISGHDETNKNIGEYTTQIIPS